MNKQCKLETIQRQSEVCREKYCFLCSCSNSLRLMLERPVWVIQSTESKNSKIKSCARKKKMLLDYSDEEIHSK